METQIDLSVLGIDYQSTPGSVSGIQETPKPVQQEPTQHESTQHESTQHEPAQHEPAQRTPASETSIPEVSEHASVETPELEGPEDYSPRERLLLRRIEELTQTSIEQDRPVEEPPTPPAPQEHNFLDGLDIDDIISDPAALNRLLLNVYNRGLIEAGKLAAENIMRTLPQTISRYVNNHVTMTEIVRDFYENNPDLRPVRRTVAAVANEIAAENPQLSTTELFNRAAEKTREILQLKRSVPANRGSTPAFARQKGRKIAPELSGLQREIDDLISSR